MLRLTSSFGLIAVALTACSAAPVSDEPQEQSAALSRPKLGLMTSLPIYWPLGAEFADLASGEAEIPWQRELLAKGYELVPLDTLTPIPGLTPDAPETNPLEGLERIAIIQPRGLSPADNVALDEWVRGGGHLLIALDPLLTGEYELPLGDPRRPSDTALIPPVITRWGLAGSFDESQEAEVSYATLPTGDVPLLVAGESGEFSAVADDNGCATHGDGAIVRCESVGEGSVTYIHDAAVFEHRELAGENGEGIRALVRFAFP